MKTWLISDTHSYHDLLTVPEDIDMVIHAGDSTNPYGWVQNQPEFEAFYEWFVYLPIQYKVLIAGNHDAWATKKYNVDRVKESGIHYLEHEYVELAGLKIFGSPYTPNFGEWHFMKDRSKLDEYWKQVPENLDILVTHGPPKGILDLSRNRDNVLEYCGDQALFNRVVGDIKPKYHVFGHIHNFEDCINQGRRIYKDITFINASVVTDRQFGVLSSNGEIIDV